MKVPNQRWSKNTEDVDWSEREKAASGKDPLHCCTHYAVSTAQLSCIDVQLIVSHLKILSL